MSANLASSANGRPFSATFKPWNAICGGGRGVEGAAASTGGWGGSSNVSTKTSQEVLWSSASVFSLIFFLYVCVNVRREPSGKCLVYGSVCCYSVFIGVRESFMTNKFFLPPTWEQPCCLVCCAGANQKLALQEKASDCGSIQQNPWHCDPHLPVIVEDSILRVSCGVVYFHCALTTALYSAATEKALPASQWHSSAPLGSVLLWTHLNLDCFTYSCFQRIRIGPVVF